MGGERIHAKAGIDPSIAKYFLGATNVFFKYYKFYPSQLPFHAALIEAGTRYGPDRWRPVKPVILR